MDKIKIKPAESQKFNEFDIEIVDISWKLRCELNDKFNEAGQEAKIPPFSFWGNIVLKFTKLKEEELNKYSTDEIIAIANKIFEVANKKK